MSVNFRLVLLIVSISFYTTGITANPKILDEVVVIASKDQQSLRDVAASISVLTDADLAIINHTHINEALARVPGVWISRGNGQEHLTAIRSPILTGAGSCGAFLLAQDGVSLRAPGFCNVNELFESVSELARRIEVIKGPASSIYGSNALHGVINVRTPDPIESLRKITIEGGPDTYYRTRLSISSKQLRVDASGTTDSGYKDASGFDQQKLLIKHRVESDLRSVTTSFSYTNLNQETSGFIVGDEVYKDQSRKKENPNPEAYRDARSYRLMSDIKQPLGKGELTLTPYLRHVSMTFLQHFLPGQATEENGHSSAGLQSLWASDSGRWHMGVEVDYTTAYLKETQPNATPGSAFLQATIPAGKHYDYDVDALAAGLFAEYHINLNDNVNLIAGARYQYTDYDYNNKMLDGGTKADGTPCGFGGCRFNRPADRSDTFNHWSPRLGLIIDLNDNNQIYGSISQGFRAPQATELYRLQQGQNIIDIDPETMDAIEMGFRGEGESLYYDLSLFVMKKDNFIFRDTNRQNVDNGATRHRGAELGLGLPLSASLSARVAFTYAKHEYNNNPALSASPLKGNEIETAPNTLGSASVTWTPTPKWQLELEWVHVGEYFEDPENLQEYEGHDLLHLRGQYRVSETVSLSARVMNLGDEDYAERADFSFGNDRYFVGTPRSVFIGASVSF